MSLTGIKEPLQQVLDGYVAVAAHQTDLAGLDTATVETLRESSYAAAVSLAALLRSSGEDLDAELQHTLADVLASLVLLSMYRPGADASALKLVPANDVQAVAARHGIT